MKKTFCACCGQEMNYEADNMKPFLETRRVMLPNGVNVVVELNVGPVNRSDLRVCGTCRWAAIDRVRAHPVIGETS